MEQFPENNILKKNLGGGDMYVYIVAYPASLWDNIIYVDLSAFFAQQILLKLILSIPVLCIILM